MVQKTKYHQKTRNKQLITKLLQAKAHYKHQYTNTLQIQRQKLNIF